MPWVRYGRPDLWAAARSSLSSCCERGSPCGRGDRRFGCGACAVGARLADDQASGPAPVRRAVHSVGALEPARARARVRWQRPDRADIADGRPALVRVGARDHAPPWRSRPGPGRDPHRRLGRVDVGAADRAGSRGRLHRRADHRSGAAMAMGARLVRGQLRGAGRVHGGDGSNPGGHRGGARVPRRLRRDGVPRAAAG